MRSVRILNHNWPLRLGKGVIKNQFVVQTHKIPTTNLNIICFKENQWRNNRFQTTNKYTRKKEKISARMNAPHSFLVPKRARARAGSRRRGNLKRLWVGTSWLNLPSAPLFSLVDFRIGHSNIVKLACRRWSVWKKSFFHVSWTKRHIV